MKRIGLALVSLAAAVALVGSPALAAKRHAGVSCKQIKDEIAAGKSADDVAKDLKTTAARVKSCTAPAPAKHHKAGTAKSS